MFGRQARDHGLGIQICSLLPDGLGFHPEGSQWLSEDPGLDQLFQLKASSEAQSEKKKLYISGLNDSLVVQSLEIAT